MSDEKPTAAEIAAACDTLTRHLNRDDLALGVGVDWVPFAEAIKLGLAALAAFEREPTLLARMAELEAVLRWFVGEFPCPEIHATANNYPGRCPEDSDDPNEWCASARFQRALVGLPKVALG